MRKLILTALLTVAPLLALDSIPAAACWFGYGYSASSTARTYSYGYATPRTYSYGYAPAYRSQMYYGGTTYRPRVALGYRAAWRAGRRWR
jgi:hypothetical protein